MTLYLTVWDLILTPIYLLVLTAIAKRMRDKRYPVGHPLRRYYMPGLYVKFFGAIFIALVYQFYYGGGDTYNFFYHTRIINSALNTSFATWFKLITHAPLEGNPDLYPYISQLYWYHDTTSYSVAVIAALFGLFCGTTYMPIALCFAFFSYTGIWAMYRTFVNVYPKFYKELAIAFLFVPSTFVWGSAVFKDTICMFGLGWMTYTTFRIFINKDFSAKNIFLLVISFYLISTIKLYILLAFLPALGLWLLLTYSHKIKSVGVRWMVNILFFGITVGGFFFFTQKFADELNKYSLENIANTATATHGWISYVSETQEGSKYDLGDFEPTIGGMITKFPQAVVVTLYRPFLWESRKPIMLLSALESSTFLFLTLAVFKRNGLKTFKIVASDPTLLFFFIYTLIFAFAVGISTGNFGSLSRYKIPCMPFFAALLLILYQYKSKTNIISNATKKRILRPVA